MHRWNNRYEEDNAPNFKELFNAHPHALELLALPNFVQDAKSHATPFTQLLLAPKNQHYLFELIEIAINPQNFTTTTSKTLNNKMTHAAIEILTNLSEDFIDLVFAGEDSNEDEVVQTEKDYPILTTIFKIAGEGQLENTSLAYFSKIVTPFIYQKPAEMISFFSEQALPLVIRYFWSSEMCELATKVLQAETEKHFFQSEKVTFVFKLLKAVQLYEDSSTLEETVQSLADFMQTLVQKHEDKYERSKTVQQVDSFSFLVSHLEKYKHNSVIKSELLHCLQAYIKIHLPPALHGKGEEQQPQVEPSKLHPSFVDALQMYLSSHSVTEFVSDIRLQLVNYYKVVKVFLTASPESIDNVVNNQFLRDTMSIMKKQQNNNILHNLQREVIVRSLTSAKVHNIVKNEIGLIGELKNTLSEGNCKSSYANQIFLISEAVLNQPTTSQPQQNTQWKALDETIANKRKFLAMPIALNKNNQDEDKWDNFESQIIMKADNITENTTRILNLKPRNTNNQPFTMVTRLDEIQGTEVLSQEEEDGFPTNDPTKTNHYYDDLGMPQLPLDSDKSEEGELKPDSLEHIPQNVRQNSAVNVNIPGDQDLPQTLNENSQNQEQPLQNQQLGLPETLGSDSIRLKNNDTEDGFPQTLGEHSSKKINAPQAEPTTNEIYLQKLNLGPQIEEFEFKPSISQLVQPKEQLSLEGLTEMTVSINIAEELASNNQEKVRVRQEIETMLYARYKLELTARQH